MSSILKLYRKTARISIEVHVQPYVDSCVRIQLLCRLHEPIRGRVSRKLESEVHQVKVHDEAKCSVQFRERCLPFEFHSGPRALSAEWAARASREQQQTPHSAPSRTGARGERPQARREAGGLPRTSSATSTWARRPRGCGSAYAARSSDASCCTAQ